MDRITIVHVGGDGKPRSVPASRILRKLGSDIDRYEKYVAECEAENLDAHSYKMWLIHGRPEGPLG